MGNCQAIDAATIVIQHPNGKVERFYSPMSARLVMKMNPAHYVALLISTSTLSPNKDIGNCPNKNSDTNTNNTYPVRLTRIKLLKPNDSLLLGHVYRLITAQEVMKGLKERKQAKMKQNMPGSGHKSDWVKGKIGLEMDNKAERRLDTEDNKVTKPEKPRPRTRFWQPSLQSISEVVG
ncbi:uncharacterized protein LOC130734548 [Lotus japonicus]|uniref:DUF4228 domain protein n=1 Tax=Lotus japonicus TaxID=34305 RepID=I3SFD8_LOTJA|nr:uncharacterized protein LOC130734548 [Lotus japonicus]AFK38980.1 unknown [Lotus japonicus]